MDGTTSYDLAILLRECADIVERGEFSADIYKALSGLHEYAGRHPGAESPGASVNNVSTSSLNGDRPRRAHPDRPGVHVQQIGAGVSSGIKKFTKGLGQRAGKLSDNLTGHHQATSAKNAERARADIAEMNKVESHPYPSGSSHGPTPTNETRMPTPIGVRSHSPMPSRTPSAASRPPTASTSTKPSFQRPKNPNTNLIANGWMEQMRRSKMQKVWKAVLCSLVEGRKAGEETTLWIQREVHNSGRAELEALHQIPIKWLEDASYLDYYGDNRFSLKVYNFSEDFMFRCKDEESAMNWVLTLHSVKELVQTGKSITGGASARAVVDETIRKVDSTDSQQPVLQPSTSSAPPSPPGGSAVGSSQPDPPSQEQQQQPTQHRMPVKELRAIAHGAGINTAGMERSELERIVAEIAGRGPTATARATERPFDEQAAEAASREEERRQAAAREEEVRQAALREEERRQTALSEEERRQAALREEERRKAAIRAAEEERRQAAEAKRKKEEEAAARAEQEKLRQRQEAHAKLMAERVAKQREEEARRRREAAAEEERLRVMKEAELRRQEEERRRAAAAAEADRQRQAEAARKHYQQQQAAWQEAERQRQAEAERQRQQQQQWQQQWQKQQQQQAAAAARAQQQKQQQQQQYYAQQQQQQRAQQQQNGFAGQQQQQAPQQGGANSKYAKMAQSEDATAAAITNIKRGILVQWALAPPHLQMLRPIGELLCNIHKVFPPAFGVPAHEYFTKWRPITPADTAEEEKLKKAHRKLRFFLHPDKLPRDLNEEQAFMCKMLWDVSNDAMEEHLKKKDELDWIKH